ncbi:hypothetical protein [Dactylosporangium sp. CA-139066]|uniref:hypothetical protein n=1 Tax=Dactylosporangium sp. CA-139066 TaxID=3239930 RepID=UPI003D943386
MFRITTDYDEDEQPDDDLLYILMDALASSHSRTATVEEVGGRRRVMQIVAAADRSYSVRHCEHGVDGLDILAAHQLVRHCLRAGGDWEAALASPACRVVPEDYAGTGLTLARAFLDAARKQPRPGVLPMYVQWHGRAVVGGDTWTGAPARGRMVVRVVARDRRHGHGLEIRAPRGRVDGAPSVQLWPREDGEEHMLEYEAADGLLQLTNVYTEVVAGRERVGRWEGNAAMAPEIVSPRRRVYRCNHAETGPPTFGDLVLAIELFDDEDQTWT